MKHTTYFYQTCAFTLFLFFLALSVNAQDKQALSIIRAVDAQAKTDSSKLSFTMAIRQTENAESRVFSLTSLENAQGDSVIEFLSPKTVRGLKILTKGNSSWVFFPSTGRIRKIGGSSRSGSVQGVGGDFSYDDLGSNSWEADYVFSLETTTTTEWILHGKRKHAEAPYDEVRLTVSQGNGLVTSAAFSLEKEGGLYKELNLREFRDYSGQTRAGKLVMKTLSKGSITEVTLDHAEFNIPLHNDLFDPSRFSR